MADDETSSQRVPIPFSRWMSEALYDEKRGYYSRRIRGVGSRGDFTTAPALSRDFARAVAGWVKDELGGMRHVVEMGAGEGHLMRGVMRELGWVRRVLGRVQFHIVETSVPLRELQQARLKGLPVTWHAHPSEALEAAGGEAVLFSNELPDAFPVDLLEWRDEVGAWTEVRVLEGQESLHPYENENANENRFAYSALGDWGQQDRPDRQRVEIGASYREWLRSWLPQLKRGSLLTIDYGDRFPQLYHRRRGGTLRAYFHQQRLEGRAVYANKGHQDITADVNFTDLMQWGEAEGLETVRCETQREFLLRRVRASSGGEELKYLMQEGGAGDAFQVLHQRRNRA